LITANFAYAFGWCYVPARFLSGGGIDVSWNVETLGGPVVGSQPKQEKSNKTVWSSRPAKLFSVLDYYVTGIMRRLSIVLLSWVAIISCSSPSGKKEEVVEDVPVSAVNAMPKMVVTLLDGTNVAMRQLKTNTIIVVFRPECDHCQHEAEEVKKNLAAFEGVKLYFVTSDPMEEIQKFADDYGLSGYPNVFFGWTSVDSVLDNFGAIATPSIYIYSEDQQLVKSFNGQVEIATVLAFIP
jgi:peroxiredoxin